MPNRSLRIDPRSLAKAIAACTPGNWRRTCVHRVRHSSQNGRGFPCQLRKKDALQTRSQPSRRKTGFMLLQSSPNCFVSKLVAKRNRPERPDFALQLRLGRIHVTMPQELLGGLEVPSVQVSHQDDGVPGLLVSKKKRLLPK